MGKIMNRKPDPDASLDACLAEIRQADKSVLSNTRHIRDLQRSYVLDDDRTA